MTLIKRTVKGSALTHQEGDDNLQHLLDLANQAIAIANAAVSQANAIGNFKLDAKLQKLNEPLSPNQMLDCAQANIFQFEIGQDSQLEVSNATQGQLYFIMVTQINGGGHVLTFNAQFKGVNNLQITQANGAQDLLTCFWDGQKMVVINHNYNL